MKALIELRSTRQTDEESPRRWFSSTDLDLIVWYSDVGAISGFEFYYDKNKHEHVFIWQAVRGYSHLAVDDGEQKPVLQYKEAPILIPDGHIDPGRIKRLFDASCENVPGDIARLVLAKLEQFLIVWGQDQAPE